MTTPKVKPAQRLTAARKLELYLATRSPEAPVGEMLRHATQQSAPG